MTERSSSPQLNFMLLDHINGSALLLRCVSQPPPLRGTSFHRKEGEPCPCAKAFPHTVISSESEKSFSFAVHKKRKGIGKRETHSIRSEITAFHLSMKNPPKAVWGLTLSA